LNTYTKLRDVSRLDTFIKTESRRTHISSGDGSAKTGLPFDLDTAIRVCRQAGYYEHAAYLANKYERHEDYLRIMIEDSGDLRRAGDYLKRLGAEAVSDYSFITFCANTDDLLSSTRLKTTLRDMEG